MPRSICSLITCACSSSYKVGSTPTTPSTMGSAGALIFRFRGVAPGRATWCSPLASRPPILCFLPYFCRRDRPGFLRAHWANQMSAATADQGIVGHARPQAATDCFFPIVQRRSKWRATHRANPTAETLSDPASRTDTARDRISSARAVCKRPERIWQIDSSFLGGPTTSATLPIVLQYRRPEELSCVYLSLRFFSQ